MYKPRAVNCYNQGRELQQQGRLPEAEGAYRKAVKIEPGFVEAYNNLGNVLVDLDRYPEAIRAYRKAIDLSPDHPMLFNNMGNALQLHGENDRAVKWLNKAIENNPAYADAYNNLGHAFSDLGDIEKAIAAFRKSIELNPENEKAYRDLARNRKFTGHDEELRAMEAFYLKPGISNEQKMHLAFGLGKAYEDLGEYEKSIGTIIEANRLKRSMISFSLTEERESFTQIIELFSADFLARHEKDGFMDPTPIFILGMPRSGTSLVEQILASHPDVFGAGELDDLPELIRNLCPPLSSNKFPACLSNWNAGKYRKTGREYVARLRKHSQDAHYISDKLPHNFMNIGLIKLILPAAKIIHCAREPMDNCLSIFKNFFSHGQHYSYDMTELGQYYRLYQELMRHWVSVLPGFIFHLDYEKLVAEQEIETRKLLEFCDLPWDESCLAFHQTRRNVKTASHAQVRQPIYRSSVRLWQHYAEHLQPLQQAIDDS